MATIQRFEDLMMFKKARELTKSVYGALATCRDNGFRDQIQRASVSIISNIAEGFDRGTKNEFVDALFIAKGEVGEVRSQLYVAYDRRFINEETLRRGQGLTNECSRLIQSFAYKVKGGSRQGIQFKVVQKPDPINEILRKDFPKLYQELKSENKII